MATLSDRPRTIHWSAAGPAWARVMAKGLTWGLFLCLMAQAAPALPPPGFEVAVEDPDLQRKARKAKKAYGGPMVDTHAHLYPPPNKDATVGDIRRSDLRQILALLEALDVEQIFFMPTPNDGIRANQELGVVRRRMMHDLDPGRVRLFGGSNYLTAWLHKSFRNGYAPAQLQRRLARLAGEIDSGSIDGVGELAIYHFDKGYRRQHVLAFAPDFEPWLAVVDLVARRGLWLDLHVEPMDAKGRAYHRQAFGGLALLYRRHPDLKLIYAHTAMTNAVNARRMLEAYPRLMMSIKVEPRHERWGHLGPVVNSEAELYEDWARLLEAHPRRFVVGTDFHFGRKGVELRKYKRRVRQVRKILGTLNPRAARLIAHDNARRMFP